MPARKPQSSREWTTYRARIIDQLEPVCHLCGSDAFEARGPWSRTVDHLIPIEAGGELCPPPELLRIAHLACNVRRGNRARAESVGNRMARAGEGTATMRQRERDAERARTRPAPLFRLDPLEPPITATPAAAIAVAAAATLPADSDAATPTSDFLESRSDPAPCLPKFSARNPRDSTNSATTRRRAPMPSDVGEMPPPRILTPVPSDVTGSYGELAEEWIAVHLGDRLRAWQRLVLERALEHRADGSLRWEQILLTVSRQQGKTILERGLCGWRANAAELFGEPQKVLTVANLKETALLPWRHVARRCHEWSAVPRYQVGAERIEWPALDYGEPAGTWLVQAANRNAGVGHSCGLIVVDEAWSVERQVVEGSLAPSQLERLCPQLWLISTAGDGGSELFAEHRSLAISQLADADHADLLLIEWSAAPDAPVDDREAWRAASSHWNERRLDRLERLYRSTSEQDFRIQYLNQWVVGSVNAWVSDLAWGRCRRDERELPTGVGSVAIETHQAGEPFGWLHAALDRSDGVVVVRAGICSSRSELWRELERIAAAHPGVRILYPEGFRHHVPRIPHAGELVKVTPSDTFGSYAAALATVRAGALAHAAQSILTEQILAAVAYTVPDRGATLSSRASSGPIYLARALVWAVGYELRPDQGHRPVVVSG